MAGVGRMVRNSVLGAAGVVVLALGWTTYVLWPRVDEVPEELEALDAELDPLDITLAAQGPLPALALRDLAGKRAFFTIEGKESFGGKEGRELKRALNRWVLPEDVVGYTVADARGFSAMAGWIEQNFVGPMRPESGRPIYVDFSGDMVRAFKLPKGHFGLVVLGPTGEILLRHGGAADAARIEEVRTLLGASEPQPGPVAPEFAAGGLDAKACSRRGCLLAFLHRSVARAEVPGIENGLDAGMEESFKAIEDPSIRLLRLLMVEWEVDQEQIPGVLIGSTGDLRVPTWTHVDPAGDDDAERSATALREAFDIPAGEAALVAIDKDGRIAFRQIGLIRFHRLSLVADALDIEGRDPDDETNDGD